MYTVKQRGSDVVLDTKSAVEQLINLAEDYMLDEELLPIRAALSHIREPGHPLTADLVLAIIKFTAAELTALIKVTHAHDRFASARFLGINSVSQFVFAADRIHSQTGDQQTVKVFVSSSHGVVTAAY